MERKLHYVLSSEDDAIVARCLEVEVTSDGPTEARAIANLREALELYFEDRPMPEVNLAAHVCHFGAVLVRI